MFATLNDVDESTPEARSAGSKQMNLDDIIMNAKTVNGLLAIAETHPDISRKHALKVARYSSSLCLQTFQLFRF